MKPWFVALQMMAIKFQQLAWTPVSASIRHLAERAKDSGKPTSGLETLEFQLTLLDQLPKRDQEMMLRETVTELDLLDKNIDQIVQSWLKGESASLEALLMAGMKDYPELHQKIIVDRNRRWLPQIEKIIGARRRRHGGRRRGAPGQVRTDCQMLKNRGYELEQQ